MARPKAKYNSKWTKPIIDLYKEGASDIEVKTYIWEQRGSYSNDLWERWMKEEEEFSETITIGKMLSETWWTKTGRSNLSTKEFNYMGWMMNMSNRFNWRRKDDVTSDDKPIDNQNVIKINGEAFKV